MTDPWLLQVHVVVKLSSVDGKTASHLPDSLRFFLQIGTEWRADARTRTALLLITSDQSGRDLQGVANSAFVSRFPFSALLRIAPYCAAGGVRVVSLSVCALRDQRQVLVNLACHNELPIAYPEEQTKEGTTFVE